MLKIDTVTKTVLGSAEVPVPAESISLSADGARLLITNGFRIGVVRTRDLTIEAQFKLPSTAYGVGSQILVYSTTGLAYLTFNGGSMHDKVFIVDPIKKTVVRRIRAPNIVTGGFTLDRKREWIWVDSSAPFAIDGKTQRIAHVLDLEGLLTKPPFNFRQGSFTVREPGLHPLPDGTLLVYARLGRVDARLPPIPPVLLVYDPDRRVLLRHSEALPDRSLRASILSADGTRLAVVLSPEPWLSLAGTDGAVIDTHTLAILHSVTFPEPASHFAPAPDGQGLWMVARSGKVYRLDDQTGQVLEPVPLPAPVSTIITPTK